MTNTAASTKGSFRILESIAKNRCSEAKWREFPTKIIVSSIPQPGKSSHMAAHFRGWRQGAEAYIHVSDPRERIRVGCHKVTLWGVE